MDSKEAIELIKSDVAHLVKTITQQDKMLELAIWHIKGCPFEICPHTSSECRDCWRKYLQGEVSK